MVSAARSRQTGQPNGDWVAVPLLFLPLATTSPATTSLHATEQPIKWHMKAFFFVREGPRQATNDGDNNNGLLDDDKHHSNGQGIGGMAYMYGSALGCDAKEVGDQGGREEGRTV
ncbi:hypothetical protein IW262DRAFT_1298967 [Armillaria fumosa]|nr:hypothetical protein IW262DRAFT_1298967 [Armillaria fumosa]